MTLFTVDDGRRIEAYFDSTPDFARAICRKEETRSARIAKTVKMLKSKIKHP